MSDDHKKYDVNPADHVELFPADVQPSSPNSLTTAVTVLKQRALPAKLADAMLEPEDIDVKVDDRRFRENRPQADFVRLPWPLATRDPENDEDAIWWYAAAVCDVGDEGQRGIVLEGMRGPDVRALARALAFAPKRVRASDLVEDLPVNEPQAGVPRGEKKSARGAGAKAPDEVEATSVAVPDDCSIVFREMVQGEAIGSWDFAQVAKYVILELWGAKTHPEYIKLKQQASGWEDTKADGLYPSGGGLY